MIDTEKVRLDWQTSAGQFQIKNIATQHGIYEHLFGYAYFLPRVPIDIKVMTNEKGNCFVHGFIFFYRFSSKCQTIRMHQSIMAIF